MAEKKKQAISAAVPWAIQEGGKALSLPERIRRTFELGVKNAELSLMSITRETQKPTETLRQMPKWLWKADKQIADEFGGKLTVHAPEDIAIEAPNPSGQARAADMIKHSLEVAKEMKSPIITVHASGTPGWAITNPLSGTIEQLPAHVSLPEPLWLKVRKELEDGGYETMAQKLDSERRVQRNSRMLGWRQQMFMQAEQEREDFQEQDARKTSYDIVNSSMSREDKIKELERIKQENNFGARKIQAEASGIIKNFDFTNPDDVKQFHDKWWNRISTNYPTIAQTQTLEGFIKSRYNDALRGWQLCDNRENPRNAADIFFETWKLELDHDTVKKIQSYMYDESGNPTDKKIKDLDPKLMDRLLDPFIGNVKKTFMILFKDKEAKKLLNSGEMKLCIENIFGPNFKTGDTGGYPMGWAPKHMEMIINAIKDVAKENGVDPNSIGMTFDTQHALVGPGEALGTSSNLDWWFDEFKKRGLKIDHAHLVGGHKGSHETWGHVGLGDVVDEVMREHPDVIDKLAEAGCLNFEAGQRNVKDLETSLETVLHGGTPPLAMAAEAGYSGGARMLGYDQKPGSFYAGAYNTNKASVTRGQFYAFSNPMERSAWQFAMGNTWYGTPTMRTPGAVLHDPNRQLQKVWTQYQPY